MSFEEAPRGFVTMAEYRRVALRCEELEQRLAEERDEQRDQSEREAIDWIRLKLRVPRQCAEVLLCLVRSRKAIERSEHLHKLLGLMEDGSRNHVSVLIHRLNETVRLMSGGPHRLITGIPGSRGGYKIDPPQRAWLEAAVPQIFNNGVAR